MIADVPSAVQYLLRNQNTDGGWSYRPSGGSWTEPTCLALIALRATPGPHTQRGLRWLLGQRRSDGGWGPRTGVAQSTWVTALGLLTLHCTGQMATDDLGLQWLLQSSGAESNWVARLRRFLVGADQGNTDTSNRGWPWYPGASAWVTPTSLTLVALDRIRPAVSTTGMAVRIKEGRSFLLARRCSDGGWNHGSSKALGYDGPSYPETTGAALLALAGEPGAASSVAAGIQHAKRCRSVEAWSWLQMGLWAQRAAHAPRPQMPGRIHDMREAAVYLLGEAAHAGRDPFGRDLK